VQPMRSFLRSIGLLCVSSIALVACGAGATTTPSAAMTEPSGAAASLAVPPTASWRTRALPEHVIAEWTVSNPSGVFIGFGSVWVPGHHDRKTTRIDPGSNQVSAVVKGTGDHAEQAMAVGDVLWVTGQSDDTTWIDPKTNAVSASMPRVPGHLHYIAAAFQSIWITTVDNQLDRVDPTTGRIVASIRYAAGVADCQGFVTAMPGPVWVEEFDTAELIKIDPATNTVASRAAFATLIDQAKAQPRSPAGKGTDSIWIVIAGDQRSCSSRYSTGLLRIDPNSGKGLTWLSLTPEQAGDGSIDVTDESVWLGGLGQINRVSVATGRIDATYATDFGTTIHPAVGFGSVWLANYDQNLVQRLDVAP
jgi:streptogramin lyase